MAAVNRRRFLRLLLGLSAAALVAGLSAMPWDGGRAAGTPQPAASKTPAPDANGCRRIVSLSPSLTEVLFALGLGDRVVGVTRYCDYPAEALKKAKVGGYLDPNYEAMVALRPDLVAMLAEHEEPRAFMKQRGIDILVCNHRTLGGIRQSIEKIGKACGRSAAAADILKGIDRTVGRIQNKTEGLDRPRVLISAGRNPEVEGLRDVYIAGKGSFFDEMIELAGGTNAFADPRIKYPKVSAEGILAMDPEIIVDIVPDAEGDPDFQARLRDQWNAVSRVKAVRTGRVHILTGEYAVIPGPRYARTVADLAKIVHPGIDWDR
jgi:iron complex transport system substrate-binding protein